MLILRLHERHVNIRGIHSSPHTGNPMVRVQQSGRFPDQFHEITAINGVLLTLFAARQPVRAVVKEDQAQFLVVCGG
jgi:hypothetical protein